MSGELSGEERLVARLLRSQVRRDYRRARTTREPWIAPRAQAALEAVARVCLDTTKTRSRFLDARGRLCCWEVGPFCHGDGAVTGSVWVYEEASRRRLGSFRIESNGWIRRFPGLGALRILRAPAGGGGGC